MLEVRGASASVSLGVDRRPGPLLTRLPAAILALLSAFT
jgi:hypothetical protein